MILKAALADTEAALREYAEIEGKAEDELDRNDKLVQEMLTHGKYPNLPSFAFTTTPKLATLEMFGSQWTDGNFHPFHIYSMRQAIEEGFILDVLQNYMTYSTCFKIAKDTLENPELPDETEWVEFKCNNKQPQMIGEYVSALSSCVVRTTKSIPCLGRR